jgi:hypothetical protein
MVQDGLQEYYTRKAQRCRTEPLETTRLTPATAVPGLGFSIVAVNQVKGATGRICDFDSWHGVQLLRDWQRACVHVEVIAVTPLPSCCRSARQERPASCGGSKPTTSPSALPLGQCMQLCNDHCNGACTVILRIVKSHATRTIGDH